MNNSAKKNIVIELLIIFAVILTVAFACVFFYNKIAVEPNLYKIEFKDINGITPGSPVRFMGLGAGYVRNLKIIEASTNSIEVEIFITNKNIKLPSGATARVEYYGLGGSKSIEILPPEDDCAAGIVSNKTIRLHDVVYETKGLVAILEVVEKMLNDVNGFALENTFRSVSEMKDEKIKTAIDDLIETKNELSKKSSSIREREKETVKKVKSMNEVVEKINKFLKK